MEARRSFILENQAQHILDRAGPASLYWMTEIAAQLSILAAAQINGVSTNLNAELGERAGGRCGEGCDQELKEHR